jgi:hypothetical protein
MTTVPPLLLGTESPNIVPGRLLEKELQSVVDSKVDVTASRETARSELLQRGAQCLARIVHTPVVWGSLHAGNKYVRPSLASQSIDDGKNRLNACTHRSSNYAEGIAQLL